MRIIKHFLIALAFSSSCFAQVNLNFINSPWDNYANQFGANMNILDCYSKVVFWTPTSWDTGSFTVGYYLSVDQTITTSDILIGTYPVAQAFRSNQEFTSCPLGAIDLNVMSIPSGTYYVGSIVDIHNKIAESDESDNSYLFTLINQTDKVVYNNPNHLRESEIAESIRVRYENETLYIESYSGEILKVILSTVDGREISASQSSEFIFHLPANIYFLNVFSGETVVRKKVATY